MNVFLQYMHIANFSCIKCKSYSTLISTLNFCCNCRTLGLAIIVSNVADAVTNSRCYRSYIRILAGMDLTQCEYKSQQSVKSSRSCDAVPLGTHSTSANIKSIFIRS